MTTTLTRVTAPTVYPVTLTEAKNHLKVDVSIDDTLITSLIAAATDEVEQYLSRALVQQTWDYKLDDWPRAALVRRDPTERDPLQIREIEIELPRAPLQSVSFVKYTATDGTLTTWSSAEYQVLGMGAYEASGRIVPAYGFTYPTLRFQPEAVQIRMVCGYPDDGTSPTDLASGIPKAIKQAILLTVGEIYENRLPGADLAETTRRLLNMYRIYRTPL